MPAKVSSAPSIHTLARSGALAALGLVAALLTAGASPAGAAPWVPLGPGGGEIHALAHAPSDPLVLYAGGPGVGVWRSVDGGLSWTSMVPGLPSLQVRSLAVDPEDRWRLFAGTDAGLFRSDDGGGTWSGANDGLTAGAVRAIAFSPPPSSDLWLATDRGVHHSTDLGISWTKRSTGLPGRVRDVAVKTDNPQVLWAATAQGVFRTNDRGLSWSAYTNGLSGATLDVHALATTPVAPDTVIAGTRVGVVGTINGGTSWSDLSVSGRPAGAVVDLAISPLDSGIFWAVDGRFWGSTDGGNSWTGLPATILQERIRAVTWIPNTASTPSAVFLGTAGGIVRDNDLQTVWTRLDVGLAATHVRALAFHPSDPARLWAGTAENGLWQTVDGGGTWTHGATGLPSDQLTALAVSTADPQDLWLGTAGAGASESTDGGLSWSAGDPANRGVQDLALLPGAVDELLAATSGGLFRTLNAGLSWLLTGSGLPSAALWDLETQPSSPGTVFLATQQGVYRSFDGGATWSAASSGLGAVPVRSLTLDGTADPEALYAGTESGRVYRSTDGATSWQEVASGLPAGTPVVALVAQPGARGRLLAATFDQGVFRSLDGGASWQPLGDDPIRQHLTGLAVSPVDPQRVYALTEGGGILELEQTLLFADSFETGGLELWSAEVP